MIPESKIFFLLSIDAAIHKERDIGMGLPVEMLDPRGKNPLGFYIDLDI